MNSPELAPRERALEQEIQQLRAKIDKLRLGRRILMSLLTLQDQQRQLQLRDLEMALSTLKRRNAQLRQMLYCTKMNTSP